MQLVYSLLGGWGRLSCEVIWSYYVSNIVGSSFACSIVAKTGIRGLAMVLVAFLIMSLGMLSGSGAFPLVRRFMQQS